MLNLLLCAKFWFTRFIKKFRVLSNGIEIEFLIFQRHFETQLAQMFKIAFFKATKFFVVTEKHCQNLGLDKI